MKHLLIIFTLLLTSVSWSKEFDFMGLVEKGYNKLWSKDVDYMDLVERGGLIYEKYSNEPFTGNSIGKEQVKIKKGKREGEMLKYGSNGQLWNKSNWKEGILHGVWELYDGRGELIERAIYKDGKLVSRTNN